MENKTKAFLSISVTVLCLLTVTLFMASCSKSETGNNQAVPQPTQDTTVPNNNATEQPLETNGTVSQNSVTTQNSSNPEQVIKTKDEAKKIVLDHAKVKESDAKKLKIELDYEDGVQVYEVEFDSAGFEYDYEINAKTGEIMKFNKEQD